MSYFRRHLGDDTTTAAAPAATPAAAAPAPSSSAAPAVSLPDPGTVVGAVMLYHGYKRTGSIIWALLYGLAGKELPYVAAPIALAQGIGQKKPCP